MPEDDHLAHARAAEALAGAAAREDERRLYLEIARVWRELAQINSAANARDEARPDGAPPGWSR